MALYFILLLLYYVYGTGTVDEERGSVASRDEANSGCTYGPIRDGNSTLDSRHMFMNEYQPRIIVS